MSEGGFLLATERGNVLKIKAMLEIGISPNTLVMDDSPLFVAARRADIPILKLLLDHGANIALENSSGLTALDFAVQTSNLSAVRTLLGAGADPNHESCFLGKTPLIFACERGDRDMAKLLIESGANPNSSVGDGLSPLHVAIIRGDVELAETLILGTGECDTHQLVGQRGDSSMQKLIEHNKTPVARSRY